MKQVSLAQFADKIGKVMPVIMREFVRHLIKGFYKAKVTLPQLLLLDFLSVNGEVKMKDLAHFMNVTTAAMTGIVERLVRDSYALRVYDHRDRRIIKVRLTARGRGLAKRINEQRRDMIIKIFGRISEPDRRDYLKILLQIKDILIEGK